MEIITRSPLTTAGKYEPRFHLFPDIVPTLISSKLWPISNNSYVVWLFSHFQFTVTWLNGYGSSGGSFGERFSVFLC